jgi:hypothetical protein
MIEWLICNQLMLMGTPKEAAWKPGIQFSIASMTSATTGLRWNFNPQQMMLGGTLPDLLVLRHS